MTENTESKEKRWDWIKQQFNNCKKYLKINGLLGAIITLAFMIIKFFQGLLFGKKGLEFGNRILNRRKRRDSKGKRIYHVWKKVWNQDALIDETGEYEGYKNCFYDIFVLTYLETYQKKERNKRKNFFWKRLFVSMILLGILAYCVAVYVFKWPFETNFKNVFIPLLLLICMAVAIWLDVKKYQETWIRHSKHLHLLEREMLLFIYEMDPYDSILKEQVFMKRIMAIWDGNQQKFGENMERNEANMMDRLKKMSGGFEKQEN